MILDGRSIIEKRYVTFPENFYDHDEQVQPNGVDLRLAKVYALHGLAAVPAEGRVGFDGRAQEVVPKEGWFHLRPDGGNVYLVDFHEYAKVPEGYCAQIITRSSLVRSGVDVITGLWDTGWEGQLGASLRLMNPIKIQYGARLAQILYFQSVYNGHSYSGRYQGSNSQTAIIS